MARIRCRGSDDNSPTPALSSELHGPPHGACSSSPGCSGQLQGPDLHYRDRPLTAQPPCRPNPDRHMARQNTLEQTPSLSTQCASFFSPYTRILCQHFSIRETCSDSLIK